MDGGVAERLPSDSPMIVTGLLTEVGKKGTRSMFGSRLDELDRNSLPMGYWNRCRAAVVRCLIENALTVGPNERGMHLWDAYAQLLRISLIPATAADQVRNGVCKLVTDYQLDPDRRDESDFADILEVLGALEYLLE